jgi:methylmalonyl-CoA mutase N-terminal domain/subunit
LRTQQIIAAESGVVNTVDPLAGSYAVESMTTALEKAAEEILMRIERAGGTLAAIESGLVQREIQQAAYVAQQAIDTGQAVVVGVNRFAESHTATPAFRVNPEIEAEQIARLQALRRHRDAQIHTASLAAVVAAARSGQNLVPPIVEAVEAFATVGEIADAMRSVFGEYHETN